jgi:hypothetical protein
VAQVADWVAARAAASGGVPLVRVPKVQVGVLIAGTTLAGLDDLPGYITGYGPVPADMAAILAATDHCHLDPDGRNGRSRRGGSPGTGKDADRDSGGDGDGRRRTGRGGTDRGGVTWRRLLTDPVSGVLTDYSSTAYRPGVVLRAAVQARDGWCTFVGCRQPAMVAELDHLLPFDHDRPDVRDASGRGQTRASNLHPLCKTHHDVKTAGIIVPLRDDAPGGSGQVTWVVVATGRTGKTLPDPLHPRAATARYGVHPTPTDLPVKDPGREPDPEDPSEIDTENDDTGLFTARASINPDNPGFDPGPGGRYHPGSPNLHGTGTEGAEPGHTTPDNDWPPPPF